MEVLAGPDLMPIQPGMDPEVEEGATEMEEAMAMEGVMEGEAVRVP